MLNNIMNFQNILAIIVGIMSSLVVLYRIIYLMIPMIRKGIEHSNVPLIFKAISLLV